MATVDMQALEEAAVQAVAGVAVGDDVISWDIGGVHTYGGPDKHGSQFVMVIGIGTGGVTVKCPLGRVAPAAAPLADAKDRRIGVYKGNGPSHQGNWRLVLAGDVLNNGSWHKTKKAAVEAGQRRLAIIDWHAAHPTHTVGDDA